MTEIILERAGMYKFKKPWKWNFKYHSDDKIYEMYDNDVGMQIFNFSPEECVISLEEELESPVFISVKFPNKTSEKTFERIEKMREYVDIEMMKNNILNDTERKIVFCDNCKNEGINCEYCMWNGVDLFEAKDFKKDVSPLVTIQRGIEEEIGYELGESSQSRLKDLLSNGFSIKEIIDYFKLF